MNFFELPYNEKIINEFQIFPSLHIPQPFEFVTYLQSKNLENFLTNTENLSDIFCWEFQCNTQILLFGYKIKNFIIKIYRKFAEKNSGNWCFDTDIDLSDLISIYCLEIKSILFCNNIVQSNIVIIFFSSVNSNHLLRYDLQSKQLTDFLSFSTDSVFIPRLSPSGKHNDLDFILNSNETLSVILISQNNGPQTFYCPSVSELQYVLNQKFVIGVQELFRFWLGNLSAIYQQVLSQESNEPEQCFDFFYNGISVLKYLNFLYLHQFVCLEVIGDRCDSSESNSSLGDQFVEQVTNLTNEYVNEAINVIVEIGKEMKLTLNQLKANYDEIRRLLDVLCENGRRFRKLVLISRWSLGAYKKIPVNKVRVLKAPQRSIIDKENWENLERDDVIRQGLLNNQVVLLKLYFQKHFHEVLTEAEIINQTKFIILSHVNKYSWNDLIKLITKLGYDPIRTLVSLCLETNSKAIRDVIYLKLHKKMQDPNIKAAKNIIDKLEDSFSNYSTVMSLPPSSELDSNSEDLSDYTQPLMEKGLDESKYKDLQILFTESLNRNETENHSQMMNLPLNWFIDFYKQLNVENGDRELLNALDLCLIDVDYKKSIASSDESPEKLKLWFLKWKDKESLLVEYLTTTYNNDLIISVIQLDVKINSSITEKIMNQFINILSSDQHSDLFTSVDRFSASSILMHLFIYQPESFIQKLTKYYAKDLLGASELVFKVHKTLPVHLMCSDPHCVFHTPKIRDSQLLQFINKNAIEEVVTNHVDGEFPILLYYLLKDNRDLPEELFSNSGHLIKSTFYFNKASTSGSRVDLFQSILSKQVSDLDERTYEMFELDEILYACLFSGISCDEIKNSHNRVINRVNKILIDNDYWNKLRKRLLRPQITDDKSSNVEQYYEVNLYSFLDRTGFPLNLDDIFAWQTQNNFANHTGNQLPTLSYLEYKHRSLFEISKYSLDYVYYLSQGRPFQAFMSIVYEFCDPRKPYLISQDILKDIVKSIYQIALSNISDEKVIGGCFGLLRLIGSDTEPLRCYVTLTNWLSDWLVNSHELSDLNDLSESTGSQPSCDDIRYFYEMKICKILKLCLSKKSVERRKNRELLLKKIEEMFLDKLKNNFYNQLSEIIDDWSFVLYFCQLQGMEYSTMLLQFYAHENEWLLFLCCVQIFGYPKDQVKLSINKFKDVCIRQHMTYIASKIEDFTFDSLVNGEDSFQTSRKTSLTSSKSKLSQNATSSTMIKNLLEVENNTELSNSKEIKKVKSSYKFSRSTLQSAAKSNLIELIFDCQIIPPRKERDLESKPAVEKIYLNGKKLLAFSLVLNHPFLSVLAYCSENDGPESDQTFNFSSYINCASCFILSSFPEKLLKEFWIKWDGFVKIEWNEDEIVDLVVFAIKNKLANVVADTFYTFQLEKYECVSSFFSMLAHTVDIWNPIQRQFYLEEFGRRCGIFFKSHLFTKDKQRNKIIKDSNLLFLNRITEISLLTSMNTVQNNFGSRFLREWLLSLTSYDSGLCNIYVKQLFSFVEINIELLNEIFTIHYEYVDLDWNSDVTETEKIIIPTNVKSKEFAVFIEEFVTKLTDSARASIGYTKSRLTEYLKCLINRIVNDVHSFPYDKKENFKLILKSLDQTNSDSHLISTKSITDLLSMAFAGQSDREEIIHMCVLNESQNSSPNETNSNTNSVLKVNHGTTNSWRRLVIPEDWQEQIFSITDSTSKNTLEEISHVNSLLNEKKWIEACNYMIEKSVYNKDATLILVSMNVACGKMDLNKLPSNMKIIDKFKQSDSRNSMSRRRGSIFSNSTNKLATLSMHDFDASISRGSRHITRYSQECLNYIRNILDVMIHGQEIVEYIYTIYCVANQMNESYLCVAKEEEFNVLTKILVGACRDKIDTAYMYLRVVDMDPDQLNRFLAEVIVQVLRAELETHFSSNTLSISSSLSTSHKSSPMKSGSHPESSNVMFTLSPKTSASLKIGSSLKGQHSYTLPDILNSTMREYALKIAKRCQLRPEMNTASSKHLSSETLLMKAFNLQDILKLTNCYRRLGKILYDYYKHFSQEVFSCQEEAEFLLLLLIQCHNCFTEAGDTVGISNCLKSAKELSKALTANSYFVLLAQLLCRIGRYGEMSYIFTALIENEHFELLLRKDMDKEGVIVPYILDYLSRYFSDDFEKVELVCLKYNCFYELAETKTKKAVLLIKKLRSEPWKNYFKESLKNNLNTIICNLLDSCKNYYKVGCYKKVHENFRKAQFYKLQQRWIEDPDKTFSIGSISKSLGKSLKIDSRKVPLPETGFAGGVRIIDMNPEEALYFLKKLPNFYTAYILIDQLRLSADVWIELIVHHVVINGDEMYMSHYIEYFGRHLSPNFVQQCSNRLDKMSTKVIGKQNTNFRYVLQHTNDVFLIKRLSEKYHLNK